MTKSPLTLQRLNMDTTWHLRWAETSLLIDPWLIGPEIDGFAWFNKQYHATEPVPLPELPPYDHILVSQSYADHCHLETLHALACTPLLGTPKVHAKLQHQVAHPLSLLPNLCTDDAMAVGGLHIGFLAPDRRLDPIYYALVIAHGNDAILYASHGFALTPAHLKALEPYDIKLLVTTFSRFQLPGFLGGLVNPGLPNAKALIAQLSPDHVINTHDEKKQGTGLVTWLAKVVYPDFTAISQDQAIPFVSVHDYQPIELT